MDKLKRRLKYYGIGFGLGLIFVFFFFQNRGCSWLPGNRVKNSILDRCIVVANETRTKMEEKGLSFEDIVNVLNDGDVNFGDSDKAGDSKVYLIEKDGMKYAFTLPYESFISEVFVDVKSANVKTSKEGMGEIVYFPADDHIVYPDSTKLVGCQQEKLGLISADKILGLLKESGKIDFAKSNLEERPKPMHYLVFTKDDKEIGAKTIWYKNKLNITSFESALVDDCQ